jgi:hypothetical protein
MKRSHVRPLFGIETSNTSAFDRRRQRRGWKFRGSTRRDM